MRGIDKLEKVTARLISDQGLLFPAPAEHPTLYEEKVKLIVARYYYFITTGDENGKMLLPAVLSRLEKEFFISTGRISDIISENSHLVAKMRKESPKQSWFKIQWSHLVW